MKIDLNQFREAYLQEGSDHLASMEADLLALRESPADTELLNSIFRSAHTIKGGGGLLGFSSLVQFTHSLENLLDKLRESQLSATEQVIEILLRSVDIVRVLLEVDPEAPLSQDAVALKDEIEQLVEGGVSTQVLASASCGAPSENKQTNTNLYRVEFQPHQDLFTSGTNPLVLLRNLAELGTFSCCTLHEGELPSLEELDPDVCYLSWTIEMGSVCQEQEIQEIFEFVEGLADISIERLDKGLDAVTGTTATEAHATPELAQAGDATHAPQSATSANPLPSKKSEASSESSSIRVSTEKVDRLIDLVGELVIAHVMTAQMVENFDPLCLPKLRDAVASMERNTRELHERVMSVRMLPVGMLFQRYPRAVYDIARSTGKKIRLEINGDEAEIDRSMLEALGDPMIHLVRNAADHGIELPDVRLAQGKTEEGLITLNAFHRAGRIVIEISDDGAGIDVARVRRKAIERGLIDSVADLSDDQIRMLIFEPGFSTRDEITDLSGRGVGMDVVRQGIQQLNGAISLTSEIGRGTKYSIELPLTLAILEGLLIRVEERTLVLPLLSVIETVPLPTNQIERVAMRGEVVVIRGEPVPLLRLSRYLGALDNTPESGDSMAHMENRQLAVIVHAGERKVGLVVDELLGQQQVVVKSLERHFRKVDGIMGATILGDGCVAPILDVTGVASLDLFGLPSVRRALVR